MQPSYSTLMCIDDIGTKHRDLFVIQTPFFYLFTKISNERPREGIFRSSQTECKCN